MSSHTVTGFQLFTKHASGWVAESPSTPLYRATRDWLNRGLMTLESNQGLNSLVKLSSRIIEGRWKRRQRCLYDQNDTDFLNLRQTLTCFLEKMKSRFPDIYLLDDAKIEGRTDRKNLDSPFSNFEDFDPRQAGTLCLNKTVSSWKNDRNGSLRIC